jgi:cell division protein FtsI/penicillin-binding protein 2
MYKRPSSVYKVVTTIRTFFQKKWFFSAKQTKEQGLLLFFGCLIGILVVRLFYIQVVQGSYYRNELSQQHSSKVDITAKRWGIFVYDDAGQAIPLATNADIYNLFVDPKFVRDAERAADIITPQLYKHFCETNGLQQVTREKCVTNIEDFTKNTILPRLKVLYYSFGTGVNWSWELPSWENNLTGLMIQQVQINQENITISQQRESIISGFTQDEAESRIRIKLIDLLTPGKKEKNYLWFFDSPAVLDGLSWNAYISIENQYYVYILPNIVRNTDKEAQKLSDLLNGYGYNYGASKIKPLFSQQDTRYVKITEWINARIAQEILKAKEENYRITNTCDKSNNNCEPGIPLLHGVWLEKEAKRYYPLGSFAANILGYITPQWNPLYGIEQYFDTFLKGSPWQIRWLATPRIGEVWSNDVSIINPVDGGDVYLTIQPFIQKKVESLITHYLQEFSADSISLLVMDPFSGNIIASANAPTFNPNTPEESYALRPLTPEDSKIVDDDSHVDIPVYYVSWNQLKDAKYDDRKNPLLEKYIANNLLGPQVFVDKNIAFPYEPWSIMKPFTVSAGLDNDEISLYDFYEDPKWEVTIEIGDGQTQYIRNADKVNCPWTHTFLHALVYSCNVGMVRIAQKIKKEAFFNYMERMWFGQPTNVELAWEDPWFLDTAANAGLARFFNNAFWQGMLATPMQIAAWYSAIVNGWYYVKPRIVDKTYDPVNKTFIVNPVKIGAQVLKKETSDKMKDALFQVVYGWLTRKFGIPWYTMWGKTWTSQISFKWVYKSGNGWTNASFVGMVTRDNLKYIIVIQVRRPRSNQFWEYTAWKIFGDLSKILIERDLIEK